MYDNLKIKIYESNIIVFCWKKVLLHTYASQSQLLSKLCFMILGFKILVRLSKSHFGLQWTLYVVIHNFPKKSFWGCHLWDVDQL